MLTMLTRTVATKLKARRMGDESGQGTTEYAILVGVLVVTRVQFSQMSVKREV